MADSLQTIYSSAFLPPWAFSCALVLNENFCSLIHNLPKFVPEGPIDSNSGPGNSLVPSGTNVEQKLHDAISGSNSHDAIWLYWVTVGWR